MCLYQLMRPKYKTGYYETHRGRRKQDTPWCKLHHCLFRFVSISETKTKINKWDLIKLKSFGITRETIKKMRMQLTEWEAIFANDATNKELDYKICKLLNI